MGDGISVLYLAVYLAAGYALARRVLPGESRLHAGVLGCAFGVALLAMLPAALALGLGFGLAAALGGAVLAAAAGLAAAFGPGGFVRTGGRGVGAPAGLAAGRHAKPAQGPALGRTGSGAAGRSARAKPNGSPAPAPCLGPGDRAGRTALLALCVPAVLFTVFLLYTHVLWYSPADGGYYTGQSGYGDVQMHLAFIKSIAVAGEMPPHYSLLAGQELFGYPFLCESVSSVFLVLGAGLKFAYILPCVPALCAVFGGVWLLARAALERVGPASLAWVLFVLGGGFGFVYFLGSKEAFASIFTGYYTTPTNYVEKNIRWVNCIADLLVPQRATLFGWALAFPCLYLLYRFAFRDEKRLWLPLGLLAGCLPLMQTHSLLALVLISAAWLVRPLYTAVRSRRVDGLLPWLDYAAVAGALCLPQLFGIIFRQTAAGSGFLQPVFNWANNGTGENYFWFYIKNLGLVYLAAIPGYFWAARPLRRLYWGGLAVLAVSEFVVFQPNYYDNIKLLYFWFLLACILAAGALCGWLAMVQNRRLRAALCAAVLVLGTLSGVLTLGREAVSRYQVFSADAAAAGAYVDANAAPDALFLTGQEHLNPVASLAGRDIVCGSTLYVYFHGMDYSRQAEAVRQMYETPSEDLLARWGVDYVYISSWERADYAVDEAFYAARYPVWFQQGEIVIYQITGAA